MKAAIAAVLMVLAVVSFALAAVKSGWSPEGLVAAGALLWALATLIPGTPSE